jgi:hypothetical protein
MRNNLTLNDSIIRIKNLFGFRLNESTNISEVDWDEKFSDVKKTCLSPESVVSLLNAELERKTKSEKERGKRKANEPIISGGNIEVDSEGNVDVDHFIRQITTLPKQIFDRNPKMEKGDTGGLQYTVNTGIPALSGVLYDKDQRKFYSINTCPGAGICAISCYARKGFYIMNDGKNLKYMQRLNLLVNDPELYESLIMDELDPLAYGLKRKSKQKNIDIKLILRWNDAGDFFAKKYYDIAISVTNQLLQSGYNVESYAYTKMGDIANITDPNFVMNFSDDANKRETDKVNTETVKISKIVPKELFKDIFVKKGPHYVKDKNGKATFINDEAKEKLKNLISIKYNIPYESIFYTDELPTTQSEPLKYNVVVLPTGDSDVGAQRKDVKGSYLLYH